MSVRLVDSHCHLDDPDFAGEQGQILENARGVGVERFLSISTALMTFPSIHALAIQEKDVFCSVGVHPNEVAQDGVPSVQQLKTYAALDKVVGLGETGLDYYHETSSKDMQWESFKNHVHVRNETGLPLIIHARDAEEDIVALLKNELRKTERAPGVIHCFTGSEAFADACLELGFYISISGILTFKNATELQRIAALVPEDRLLVETDAPWLAPMPHRGKRNEPAYVRYTAEKLAELRGVSLDRIAAATTDNFYRLFWRVQ